MSSTGTNNGISKGIDSLIAQRMARERGGIDGSPIGGLFGANQLEGGISLNPDGTVGSVSAVKPKHHILDALLNASGASHSAQAQNAAMQQSGLQTTQAITMAREQAALQQAAQAQQIQALKEQATSAALDKYGAANNVIVRNQDGSLTPAGQAAIATLDPKKIEADVAALARQQTIANDPAVQAAQRTGAIAQGNAPQVKNFTDIAQATKTPLGATDVLFDPNTLEPKGTITGGTQSSQSTSQPVVATGLGGVQQHLGDKQSSISGITDGGYTPAAIPVPEDIRNRIRTTGANGEATEVAPQTKLPDPENPNENVFMKGLGGFMSNIGQGMHSDFTPQFDSGLVSKLLEQGSQQDTQQQTNSPSATNNIGQIDMNPESNNPMDGSSLADIIRRLIAGRQQQTN